MANLQLAYAPALAPIVSAPAVEVELFQELDTERWDDFVWAHSDGTPFHLTAWKRTIESTFGFKPYYMLACSDGQVCGVLPLFLVEGLFVRKALISSPFAVYGGVLANGPQARESLRAAVEKLASRLQVQYVEIRNWTEDQTLGFHPIPRYVTFTRDLATTEPAILEGIPRKTRAAVRNSLKAGLETRTTLETAAFEDLYARNLRRLGTPSFPSSLFKNLLANFRGQVDVREIVHESKVIASVLTFHFRDRVLPYYGASDPQFNSRNPNNFMYFDLMRWAASRGYKTFDFGRSKKGAAGSYDFKAHWGMEERSLPYEILLVRRKNLPNLSPTNPKFAAAISLWRSLPLAVTRWLGPRVIRMFP
jgi:FemAB-related protein (PEP-CTERM system-associated)